MRITSMLPSPGRRATVWFRLIYTDDQGNEVGVWQHVPRTDSQGRPEHTVALEYQRYLAMTEGTVPTDAAAAFIINKSGQPDMAPAYKRRFAAVPNAGVIVGQPRPAFTAPLDPSVPQSDQYKVPSRSAKFLIESFARHVAELPHPEDADRPSWQAPKSHIKSVKIYRAMHMIAASPLIANGVDSVGDPTLFRPYYMGEYGPEGKLLDPDDPFLYWLLPIMPCSAARKWRSATMPCTTPATRARVRHGDSKEWVDPMTAE